MSQPATPAVLVLENEEPLHGIAVGYPGMAGGLMVTNAIAAGFPELVTDPAYGGLVVCFTYPHVGNAGVVPADLQSDRVHARAVVAREICKIAANRLGEESMPAFLKRHKVPGIEGLDTRRITEIVRSRGAVKAAVGCGEYADPAALAKELAAGLCDYTPTPTRRAFAAWTPESHDGTVATSGGAAKKKKVIVYDLGVKTGFLRRLAQLGLSVWLAPHDYPAADALRQGAAGVVFSSGPGSPADWQEAVKAARELAGKLPLFGTGLGAGVLAEAAGAKTRVESTGHHGTNPIGRVGSLTGEMTAQAHSFWLDEESLAASDLAVTHRHLNDKSVEGFACDKRGILGVLFHPEAEPGPRDGTYVFDRFAAMLREKA